jgi:hypothetical protein
MYTIIITEATILRKVPKIKPRNDPSAAFSDCPIRLPLISSATSAPMKAPAIIPTNGGKNIKPTKSPTRAPREEALDPPVILVKYGGTR